MTVLAGCTSGMPPRHQRGQALAETVIALALIVPLFLLVPMSGKYAHIGQAVQQAARTAAWEAIATEDFDATALDARRADLEANPGVAVASDATPQAGPVCDALRGDVEYQPVPRMGPDFSGSALEMFRVEGKPEVRYASRPVDLQGAPEGTTIQHAYALDEEGSFELTVCFHSEARPGFQAHAGPIRSSGGEHPVVTQVFVGEADHDPAPELVMLVSWAVANALGTSGRLYEPVAFDFPEEAGLVPGVPLDGHGLESGVDGVMEGEPVEYLFKTEAALRTKLQGRWM